MSLHDGLALAAIVILTGLNAFFTLAETALVTVRNARLQQIAAEGAAAGDGADGQGAAFARVQALLHQPTRVVATVQVGITLAAFGTAALAAATLTPDVARVFFHWGLPHPTRLAGTLLTLTAALVTIAAGEIVPRSVALRSPERIALWLARPLGVLIVLFTPLVSVALGLSNLLVKPFGLTATFATPVVTEDELRALLEASARSGAIEEEEKEIIRNVISFGDTDVRQVMTPRIHMAAAEVGTTLTALLEVVIGSGHSRIPLYEGSVDSVVGIVHAKDLLPPLAQGRADFDCHAVMRPPLFVPENKRVDELLEELRRASTQIAIVQDEYGGTAGLVTIEDLLEELVGDIKDEYDAHEAASQEQPLQVLDAQTSSGRRAHGGGRPERAYGPGTANRGLRHGGRLCFWPVRTPAGGGRKCGRRRFGVDGDADRRAACRSGSAAASPAAGETIGGGRRECKRPCLTRAIFVVQYTQFVWKREGTR